MYVRQKYEIPREKVCTFEKFFDIQHLKLNLNQIWVNIL